jgi:serine/threonine protein kinase
MPRPLDVASTIGGAVGGVMSIILLIILIIVIGITLKCYCIKVKKNKERQLTMQNGTSMDSIESGIDNSRYVTNNNGVLQKKLTSKMLNIDKNQMLTLETSGLLVDNDSLRLLDCIGEGEFGLVYKAHLFDDDGMPTYVAVKTLKGSYDQNEISELLTESLRMKQLLHPNVMGLVGVSINAGPAPFIILPFMAGGSLLSYLKRNRTTILLNGDVIDEGQEVEIKLLSMCLQIAKGMEYISSQNLIHRDLAARNCMIDHQGIIKVSDFGLSKNLYEKMYFRQEKTEGVKLPIKWMAIESINDGVFSEKTDVWSFGITCWEIFSGGKGPFGGISPMNLSNLLEQGQRLNKPNNNACSNNTYDNVMMVCWHSSPDDRPTFAECVVSIGNTLTSLADYLDFNQFKLETTDINGTDTNGTDINGTDDDKENLT